MHVHTRYFRISRTATASVAATATERLGRREGWRAESLGSRGTSDVGST